MSVAHNLTQEQLDELKSLTDAGLYNDFWQKLAGWGDSYADNASAVTGGAANATNILASWFGYAIEDLVELT
ncbi:MAG: hypothetical protein ACR2PW_01375 [Gammaproteobacteria bacterium]